MPEAGAEARALLDRVRRLDSLAAEALAAEPSVRHLALERLQAVSAGLVDAELRTIPITRLKGTTQGRLRIGPVEDAGYRTIADVLAAPDMALQMIPGVGPQTVAQLKAAARRIGHSVGENIQVTLDPDRQDPRQTGLLAAIRCLQDAEQMTGTLAAPVAEFRTTTGPLGAMAQRATSKVTMLLSTSRRKRAAIAALDDLDRWMSSDQVRWLETATTSAVTRLRRPAPDAATLWADYEARSAEYWTTLGQLGALGVDVDAAQGHVPDAIAQKVKAQALDGRFLEVGLRGYQDFGARFALAQRRIVLGDEMGLGKTIEALAAIAHLRAVGERHFLVVCPASVVVNWLQEIDRRTTSELPAYRLHGPHRDWCHRRWLEQGGIAVTTYGTLSALPPPDLETPPAMLVVDEAHYVKNPQAQRSRQVSKWTGACERVLFMTGTPMENRVEEFQNLVHYLQPEVAKSVDGAVAAAGAVPFRKAVAPAYLRRNQTDVLSELPERLEMEDWVELGQADGDAYAQAVASGNFMAMRRAAWLPGTAAGSEKLARLLDIVEESEANGWKVVAFSYFRDVLRIIEDAVGDAVVGQLNGGVNPNERQRLVDQFTRVEGHAVLVSQIEAGGVGLNIQAGSVVVLAEPQWKPSTEEQAIARCHRMGQIRRVHVHRLLAEDTVDRRMLDIVRYKSALFDAYARQSEVKDANPEAVDVSDVETAQRLATMPEAQAEAEIIRLERERLGLSERDASAPGG